MKKTTKLVSLALVLTMTLSIAALSGCGSKKPAKKTHDPVTFQSSVKNELIPHNFVDGKCTLCDETTVFRQDPLSKTPDLLNTECSEKGTVIEITYDTRAYYVEDEAEFSDRIPEGGVNVTKTAYVYLPYGYDEKDSSTKYNVMYLLHGSGLNEGYWLRQGTYANETGVYTGGFGTQNILDALMKDGTAEKTIIVTPSLYASLETLPDSYHRVTDKVTGEQFDIHNNNYNVIYSYWKELKNDLMPYIAENFNTYAASGSPADLIAARDHQAYCGLSLGGMTSYGSVATHCIDYISYIGTFSGGPFQKSVHELAEMYKANCGDYKLNYWYATAGTAEGGATGINTFVQVRDEFGLQFGSDIKNGDSGEYVVVNGTAHNYATWITALYNVMHVFFKK